MSSWSDGELIVSRQGAVLQEILGPHETPVRQKLTLEIDGDLESGLQLDTQSQTLVPRQVATTAALK